MKASFLALAIPISAAGLYAASGDTNTWNPKTAAAYLDQRQTWWAGWKAAAKDHDTFCVSCHGPLSYAMSRSALRTILGEHDATSTEKQLLENVRKRVTLWSETQPFYPGDKAAESRGTESIINALILTLYDAGSGKLSEQTRAALDNMWALQLKDGDAKGAWTFMNFHYEPWEADGAQYWGATLVTLAVAAAPKDYRESAAVRDNLKLVVDYLSRKREGQPLINRVYLLLASTRTPGLLTPAEKSAVIEDICASQQADGGWVASALIPSTWKRKDTSQAETKSDGYATGLIAYALQQAGAGAPLKKALAWLIANQDKTTGSWPAASMNKHRDPASDAAPFMTDAATAYSVLALTSAHVGNAGTE